MARAIRAGDTTPSAVMKAHLERIAAREPEVGAFIHLDADRAMERARAADRQPAKGPLHGVPFAIKDIIDTDDMPTGWGSDIFAGRQPDRNAKCVQAFLDAGAIPVGKTVTTEFAYFRPGKTANPHNLAHTPGGSSSGSAAAVADYMVPLAFGSQTAASLIRPAAYCGVCAFKPTTGAREPMACRSASILTFACWTCGLAARRAARSRPRRVRSSGLAFSTGWALPDGWAAAFTTCRSRPLHRLWMRLKNDGT
jgi:amidase